MQPYQDSQQNEAHHVDAQPDERPAEQRRAANRERRRLKLLQFQDSPLELESFASAIGYHAGGLLEIGSYLEELILKKLSDKSVQITDIAEVTPALESHLRVSKQAERYAVLSMRLPGLLKQSAAEQSTPQSAVSPAEPHTKDVDQEVVDAG